MFETPIVYHAAAACKPVIHYVPKVVNHLVGVTYLNASLAVVIGAAIAGGLAWYIRGRGLTGVKTDIQNAETTVKTAVASV